MPIELEDGFLVDRDPLFGGRTIGIQSERLVECIARVEQLRATGVFGFSNFGFQGADLDFLRELPWLESVWFPEAKLRDIDGLYSLPGLRRLGVGPKRPAIEFSRFPRLARAVIHPTVRDTGLHTCSELRLLRIWRHPPKGKEFSLTLPDSLVDLGLYWSSLSTLDSVPAVSELRSLDVGRCRNLESLGDLGRKFPRLEHLVVRACGRVKDGEGERVARDLLHLTHAWVRDAKVV